MCVSESFPDGSVIKNPPAMEDTRIRLQGREDPLEKEMATHYCRKWQLQYSCLGNPEDRGAWRAIAYGIAESDRTEQLTHAWFVEYFLSLEQMVGRLLGTHVEDRDCM